MTALKDAYLTGFNLNPRSAWHDRDEAGLQAVADAVKTACAVPSLATLTAALGEKHLDGAHGIHIVGKGWIELPAYVREELAVEILKLFTPSTDGSDS